MNRDAYPFPIVDLGAPVDGGCQNPDCTCHQAATAPALDVVQLALEIADEYARADIECKARGVRCNHPMPVYDTTEHDPDVNRDPDLVAAGMEDVRRAVRYLTLRGLLTRPIEGRPHLVSFGSAA